MEALRCLKFVFHDYRGGHRELAVRPNEKMGGGAKERGRKRDMAWREIAPNTGANATQFSLWRPNPEN